MSTLADAMKAAVRRGLREARVALPGRLEAYDASQARADVFPLLREEYFDEEGLRQSERLPIVRDVPVVFPGAGGFRLTFPVAVGDSCLLLFSDRSLDTWLTGGGEADPVDPRAHHLSDAVALLGLRDFGHAWRGADTPGLTLGEDGGAQIHIEAGTIRLGERAPAYSAALAELVSQELSAMRAAFNLHTHGGVQTGGGTSGVPVAGMAAPASVASATVKVRA